MQYICSKTSHVTIITCILNPKMKDVMRLHILLYTLYLPLPHWIYTAHVFLIFGTSIPTSFNILMNIVHRITKLPILRYMHFKLKKTEDSISLTVADLGILKGGFQLARAKRAKILFGHTFIL